MTIICIEPQSDLLWQSLVENYQSSIFHSPGWSRVLADTYGLEMQAYVLLDETEKPEAGLPFCRLSDIKGKRLVTLPFSDYCDPLVKDRSQWHCLINQALNESCPIALRCVHNHMPLEDDRFELYNRAKWHGLDLQADLDALWHGLDNSARRAIRKAEQSGVIVRLAQSKKDLRRFFELHLGVRKYKYRLLAQPYYFFENIWREFVEADKGRLLIAIYQDKIVAGTLFLEWNNGLYYKFNASTQASLSYRPNDLLTWEGIKYGKAQGYRHLDFGLSDWDQAGLLRYKRKFATAEKTISFLKYDAGVVPTEPQNQLLHLLPQLTELFTNETVSDEVTEKAGQVLYRYFV